MIKIPVEYLVIHGTHTKLTRNMELALRDGFEPQGGIAGADGQFMQAVVRYEYVSEEEYSRRLTTAQEGSGYKYPDGYGRYR